MPFPTPNGYGIIDNPLIFSPFTQGAGSGGSTSNLDMLFMDGQHWLLMDGEQLLSMNS
jgi:hypothetical protein